MCKGVAAMTPVAFRTGQADQYCIDGAGMKLKYGAAMSADKCDLAGGAEFKNGGEVALTQSKEITADSCACGNVLGKKWTATTTPAPARRLAAADPKHYCHGWASDTVAKDGDAKKGTEFSYTVNEHVSCVVGGADGAAAVDGQTNITVAHCQCGSVVCPGGDSTMPRGCEANFTKADNATLAGKCTEVTTTTSTTTTTAAAGGANGTAGGGNGTSAGTDTQGGTTTQAPTT